MNPADQSDHLGIERIFHPTDFSEASQVAFAHALKMTLNAKCELALMHVEERGELTHWGDFPGVRATLERWNLLPEGSTHEDIEKIGIGVAKILSKRGNPVDAAREYLAGHHSDLIVLATHQSEERARWMHRHVAEPIARSYHEMTLFIPEGIEGFVSRRDGTATLKNILIPIDHDPEPQMAVEGAVRLARVLGCEEVTFTLLHVGDAGTFPEVDLTERDGWSWATRSVEGAVVETIVEAEEWAGADLVVMATAGHHGFLDALRGTTTERVLRHAHCPLLAIPPRV